MTALCFYKPTTVVGKIVAWWTDSEYSHVAIQHDLLGSSMLSEANEWHGVRVMPLDASDAPAEVLGLSWLPDEWASKWLTQRWGTKYGWRDLFAFVYNPRRKNRRGMICSELVAGLLTAYAINHWSQLPPEWVSRLRMLNQSQHEDISPGHLWSICTGQP